MARRLKLLIVESQPWCPHRQLWTGEARDLVHLVSQLEATYALVGVTVEHWDEEFDEWCGPGTLADLPNKVRVRMRAVGRAATSAATHRVLTAGMPAPPVGELPLVAASAAMSSAGRSVQLETVPEGAPRVTPRSAHGTWEEDSLRGSTVLFEGAGVATTAGLSAALTQALDDSYFEPSSGPRAVSPGLQSGLVSEGSFTVSTRPLPPQDKISGDAGKGFDGQVISRRNGRSFWRRRLRHRLDTNDGSYSFTLSRASVLIKQQRDGRVPAVEWQYDSLLAVSRRKLTMFQVTRRADGVLSHQATTGAIAEASRHRTKRDIAVAAAASTTGTGIERLAETGAEGMGRQLLLGNESFEFWAAPATVQTVVDCLTTLIEERRYATLPNALAKVRGWKKEKKLHAPSVAPGAVADADTTAEDGNSWMEEALYAPHSAVHADIAAFHGAFVQLCQVTKVNCI